MPQVSYARLVFQNKSSTGAVMARLVGDYRREHVSTLRESLTAYKQCQQLIQSCDHEIEQYLSAFESKAIPEQP